MKIAHILPASIKFPLKQHNGRYIWVKNFIENNVEYNEIYLFCNKESQLENQAIKVIGLDILTANKNQNNKELCKMAINLNEIDVIHSHFDNLHYEIASYTDKPIIFTQHWKLTDETISLSNQFKPKNVFAVPVSQYQYNLNLLNGINSTNPIYHGVDLDRFKFSNKLRNNKFVFIGRIAPHKGVLEAIKIAISSNNELDIYGKVEKKDEDYFQEIKPYLDNPLINYYGPLEYTRVSETFAQYKAFLFPVQDVEAFGLVFIECMATGTPVLTLDLGPVKEIVAHNISGYVAQNLEDLKGYAMQIDKINNQDCRLQAEKFSYSTMTAKYNELYKKIINY